MCRPRASRRHVIGHHWTTLTLTLTHTLTQILTLTPTPTLTPTLTPALTLTLTLTRSPLDKPDSMANVGLVGLGLADYSPSHVLVGRSRTLTLALALTFNPDPGPNPNPNPNPNPSPALTLTLTLALTPNPNQVLVERSAAGGRFGREALATLRAAAELLPEGCILTLDLTQGIAIEL